MKGSRGSVAALLSSRKHSKPLLGVYYLLLTNSLTPTIGSVSGSSGLTVVSGRIRAAAAVNGTINLSGIPAADDAADSFIIAATMQMSVVDELGYLYFGGAANAQFIGLSIGLGAGGGDAFLMDSTGGVVDPAVRNLPANTDVNLLAGYDAQADMAYIYFNGVLGASVSAPITTSQSLAKNIITFDQSLAATGSTDISNIHYIGFPGAGLPSLGAIATAHNATPAAKLATWAT